MTIIYSSPRVSINALDVLLRQCYTSPACQKVSGRRHFASTSKTCHEATDIAILGGGITGLASAYYLSRSLPDARLTLIEASSRLGGWLHSTSVDVGTGNVVFEQGPRNLRPTVPNGLVTLDLVRDLGLEDRVLMTSKSSVAAQNRFIYFPDHLVRMPGPGMSFWSNVSNVLSEPVFNGTVSGALTELTKPRRDPSVMDESIGSFLSRRFGSALADNVASAVFHGIYAGDIYKLSARTILAGLWETERRHISVVAGMLQAPFGGEVPVATADLELVKEYNKQPKLSETLETVKKSSVFTFKGGLEELGNSLVAKLSENPMVNIRKETVVKSLKNPSAEASSKIAITTVNLATREAQNTNYSHIISTIGGDKLADVTSGSSITDFSPTLGHNTAVTVMVVNLFFANPDILPVHGFGYLLPRTVPFEENPERALGVVFDTDASLGQDAVSGTKVTVMFGGHWWDDFDTYPDEDEGATMAKAVLQRHLGIDEQPRAVRVSLQRNCIPQYGVGHDERMEDAHLALSQWGGRLRVAGNSYTGVGLNDCVRAASDVVKGLVDGTGKTGLDNFVGGKKWSWVNPSELGKV